MNALDATTAPARSTRRTVRAFDRFARVYDRTWRSGRRLAFEADRVRLLAGTTGRVLEVGVGTGLNLPLYPASCRVVGLDVSAPMLERAAQAAAELPHVERLVHGTVADLADDERFDAVVLTWVLCWVAEPEALLADARRHLAPGGRLLLIEPSIRPASPTAAVVWRLCAPFTRLLAGSRPLRDAAQTARSAGFEVTASRRFGAGLYAMVEARVPTGSRTPAPPRRASSTRPGRRT
jgi:ubiquinone/menaquinone biosynthesis C-methylase UbiE